MLRSQKLNCFPLKSLTRLKTICLSVLPPPSLVVLLLQRNRRDLMRITQLHRMRMKVAVTANRPLLTAEAHITRVSHVVLFVVEEDHTKTSLSMAAASPQGSDYVGGRLQQFYKVWESICVHPRVMALLQEGNILPEFRFAAKTSMAKHAYQCIQRPSQTVDSSSNRNRNARKEGDRSYRQATYSRVLQSDLPGPQTKPKVETSDRSEFTEQISACTHMQDGDSRSSSPVFEKRGMGLLSRYKGCLLSCTYAQKSSEIPKISDRSRCFSICCPTIWHCNRSSRIYSHSKRGKVASFVPRYPYACVSR